LSTVFSKQILTKKIQNIRNQRVEYEIKKFEEIRNRPTAARNSVDESLSGIDTANVLYKLKMSDNLDGRRKYDLFRKNSV
jgi:hypothetical protein